MAGKHGANDVTGHSLSELLCTGACRNPGKRLLWAGLLSIRRPLFRNRYISAACEELFTRFCVECIEAGVIKLLLWCILFVLCWPLALVALLLYPLLWLLLLPFRIVGIAVEGV